MFVCGAYDELVLCGTCPQWTVEVSTVFSLVVRVTFPTLAASLPPAPATLATAALPLMLRSLDISSKY